MSRLRLNIWASGTLMLIAIFFKIFRQSPSKSQLDLLSNVLIISHTWIGPVLSRENLGLLGLKSGIWSSGFLTVGVTVSDMFFATSEKNLLKFSAIILGSFVQIPLTSISLIWWLDLLPKVVSLRKSQVFWDFFGIF